MTRTLLSTLALLLASSLSVAQTLVELPAPQKSGGMPLLEALSRRATQRDFDTTSLTMQQLSDLLWASCGVNRAALTPKLTLRPAQRILLAHSVGHPAR